jgi:hypothetical protein
MPKKQEAKIDPRPVEREVFDFTVPEEVFGFNCESCGTVMFANTFPITCDCGFLNNELVLKNQNILNGRK